jgi:hypothetical protein
MDTKAYALVLALAASGVASGIPVVAQPVIVAPPQWQTNFAGSTAMFSVVATGSPPLFYQWQFGATARPGATNATLVLTNVQSTDQGRYTVVVTNLEGATSAVARLFVFAPPRISPTNPSVSLGADVTLTATASGFSTGTNYQWLLNDVMLAGRTNSTLTLSNVQTPDAGSYSVAVTNLASAATSQVATLVVDPTFTKITKGSLGTDMNSYWNGSWADYDNDGYLDLFIGTWYGSKTNYLYHNNGDGTFTRVPSDNIPKIPSNQHGSSWGDYDNDGYLDLIVTAGNPEISHNVIYRNNGNGTFTAITNGPIYNETTGYDVGFHGPSWVDYNNDGFLDLFVAGHTPQNHLWRNNGDGSFTKLTNSIIVNDVSDSEGRTWVDYDNDGHIDLFVCNSAPYKNVLYRNNGDATFTKITNSVLTSTVDDSLACAWGDYNNDGYLDVFLANGFSTHGPNSLYKNNGDGTFAKILEGSMVSGSVNPSGWSSSCAWGDFDNDGYLDLFVTEGSGSADVTRLIKNQLYHNNGDGTFTRIMEGSLVNDLGRGIAASWVDYDKDGFLDLFIANGGFWAQNNGGALLTNFLYHNNGNSNAWITIRLAGTVSNRSAIGAKVQVHATIRGQTMWQVRQIFGGDSESNEQPLEAHFGLGDATKIDLMRVQWPSGTVQELREVAVKQFLTVTEPLRFRAAISNGVFQTSLTAWNGQRFAVDTSSNLVDWSPLATVTHTNRTMVLTDLPDAPERFYRARPE